MKQAILITAYKDYFHLEKIIECFDFNFEIYIHIDKKSIVSKKQKCKIQSYDIVKHVSQKYRVNWGGFNHLKSILYLSEQALKNPEIEFFHLISGNDYPIKSINEFLIFFKNKKVSYLDAFSVPNKNWHGNGGLDRLEYYNFYDIFNWKNKLQRKIIKKAFYYQKKVGFKRSISKKIPQLYGGSTWWSLNRDCLDYAVTFTKLNKFFYYRFKHTFCSEEFYFQTVLMNSGFKKQIYNNNLRYIDWTFKNGNNPAVLDNSDYEKLLASDAFFARKMDYPISENLIENLNKVISIK